MNPTPIQSSIRENSLWQQRKAEFLAKAERAGSAEIYAFHGTDHLQSGENIWHFLMRRGAAEPEGKPVWFAFFGTSGDTVYSLDEVCEWFSGCCVKLTVVPMLLQKGYFYERLAKAAQQHNAQIGECVSEEAILTALRESLNLKMGTPGETYHITMLHTSPNGALYKALKETLLPYGVHICRNLEDVKALELPRNVTLSVCYMLPGGHVMQDIFGAEDSIYSYLTNQCCVVTQNQKTLIELL